jgi:ABC-type transport system involved in cytochrome c biogenesis permease subunit
MAQSVTFWTAVTLYACATILFFVWLAFRRESAARWGLGAAAAALLPHCASLALRWQEVGHGPFSTRYEVLSANAFVLVALFLLSQLWAPPLRGLGAFVMPAVFLMMGLAVDTFGLRNEVPIIFKSVWLYLHIGFAKAFGGATLLAAASALAYLLKSRDPRRWDRLPLAERLDLYAHQFLLVAFLFLGVMIVAGSLWAHQSWGRYWAWDPIETSALSTWIGYGVILHFRILHGWGGRRMAFLTFVAFAMMVVTLYVVVLVTPTIHNFYMVGRP